SIRSQLDLLVNHTPLVQEMFAISPWRVSPSYAANTHYQLSLETPQNQLHPHKSLFFHFLSQ
ncbi:hypothetical protein Q7I24_20290, partial [Aeromonas veronii]|uniref:hypothetical protein n=1 Tax=Aeromonas veronii TaxID=654 RepID=UPI0030070317